MRAFFSIIVATYNAAAFLPKTLESLAHQTCRDFNVIIQDGESTDNTVLKAQQYGEELPSLLLQCEQDSGIYDAWNKALARWRGDLGEWILFLGAGDELDNEHVLAMAKDHLNQAPQEIVFAGGSVYRFSQVSDANEMLPYIPYNFWQHHQMVPHTGLFQRSRVFYSHRFDTSFRIAGDFDFLCRVWNMQNGDCILPFVVTRMLRGGISDNPSFTARSRLEIFRIRCRYFPGNRMDILLEGVSVCKGFLVTTFYKVFGRRAPAILNFLRILRGKAPCWKNGEL